MIITDYLVNKMTEDKIIEEDKDLYIYGLNNGFAIIINIITSIFLAIVVQKVDILLFLLFSFVPLRSYCGGIHCKSRILCYFYSNIIITILLLMQDKFYDNIYFYAIITLISSLFIFTTKTKGNSTRYLDDIEIKYYTHLKRIILFIILVIVIFFVLINKIQYVTTLMTSINLAATLVVLEYIKNKKFNLKFSIL